jgi:hypothetical protein
MQAWTELLKTIGSWEPENKQQDKSEFKRSLRVFDESWAQFEHKYILGLMHIEDQAKKLVRNAIQQECKLHELESVCVESDCAELVLERNELVQCISRLNAVANTERKGRSDLGADILCRALELWQGPEKPGRADDSEVEHEKFKKIKSVSSDTSSASSVGGVTKRVFGILKSVTGSTKASSKVVRFFPEEEVGDDDDTCIDNVSNASTASTEEHHSSSDEQKHGDQSCVQCLAGDVVESYEHIRYYLRDISNSLERIDPNLSSNSELVSRLEDWEESWEVGRDYVVDSEMLEIVSELVSFLKEAEKLEPAFADMTQECGAEFCLCLPRLVWLHFLQDPKRHMKILQRFLPHHFSPSGEDSQSPRSRTGSPTSGMRFKRCRPSDEDSHSPWSATINDLLGQYQEAEHELTQLSKRVADRGCSVHRFLVQSVIAGPSSEEQPDFAPELDAKPDSSALVHAIEERSMELQRHQPAAWNHFMMVIVRCFSQGAPKRRQRMGPKAPVPKLQPARSRRSLWRNRPRLRTMPFPDAIACLAGN